MGRGYRGVKEGRSFDKGPWPANLLLLSGYYFRRSLTAPFLSLRVPLSRSAFPSAFLSLSPVRVPAASLMRPLALSAAPSILSWLLLLGTTRSFPSSPVPSTYWTQGRWGPLHCGSTAPATVPTQKGRSPDKDPGPH